MFTVHTVGMFTVGRAWKGLMTIGKGRKGEWVIHLGLALKCFRAREKLLELESMIQSSGDAEVNGTLAP